MGGPRGSGRRRAGAAGLRALTAAAAAAAWAYMHDGADAQQVQPAFINEILFESTGERRMYPVFTPPCASRRLSPALTCGRS